MTDPYEPHRSESRVGRPLTDDQKRGVMGVRPFRPEPTTTTALAPTLMLEEVCSLLDHADAMLEAGFVGTDTDLAAEWHDWRARVADWRHRAGHPSLVVDKTESDV